jgi:hypothetical protein
MRGLQLQISVSKKKNVISLIRILSPEGTLGTGIKSNNTTQTALYMPCNRELQINYNFDIFKTNARNQDYSTSLRD